MYCEMREIYIKNVKYGKFALQMSRGYRPNAEPYKYCVFLLHLLFWYYFRSYQTTY